MDEQEQKKEEIIYDFNKLKEQIESLIPEIKMHLDDFIRFRYEDEDFDFDDYPYLFNNVVVIAAFCYYYHFWSEEEQYFEFRRKIIERVEEELGYVSSFTKSLWENHNGIQSGIEHKNTAERDIELQSKQWLTDLIWESDKMIAERPERVLEEPENYYEIAYEIDYWAKLIINSNRNALFPNTEIRIVQGVKDTIHFVMNKAYLEGLKELLRICNKKIQPEQFNLFWPVQFEYDPSNIDYLCVELSETYKLFSEQFIPSQIDEVTLIGRVCRAFETSNQLLSVEWGQADGYTCEKCRKPKNKTIGNGKLFPSMETNVGLSDAELTLFSRIYEFKPITFKLENKDKYRTSSLLRSQEILLTILQKNFQHAKDIKVYNSLCTLLKIGSVQQKKLQEGENPEFQSQKELWDFLYQEEPDTKLNSTGAFWFPLSAGSVITLGNFVPHALQEFKESVQTVAQEISSYNKEMKRTHLSAEEGGRFTNPTKQTMWTPTHLRFLGTFYIEIIRSVFTHILHYEPQKGDWNSIFEELERSTTKMEKKTQLMKLKKEFSDLSKKLKCVSMAARTRIQNPADSDDLPSLTPVLKRSSGHY